MIEIIQKLDHLAALYARRNRLDAARAEALDSILTDQQRERAREVEAEFSEFQTRLTPEIEAAEKDAREAVLLRGESVKGVGVHAIFRQGAIKWNSDALVGYARAGHMEIMNFASEGKPSVALKELGKTERVEAPSLPVAVA